MSPAALLTARGSLQGSRALLSQAASGLWRRGAVRMPALSVPVRCVASDSPPAEPKAAEPKAEQQQPKKQKQPKQKGQKNQNQKGQKGQKGNKPEATLEEIMAMRMKKADTLREAGQDPYAYRFERSHMSAALQEQYAELPNGEEAELETPIAVAGRIVNRRVMGKLAFLKIQDDAGSIQLYVDKKRLEENQPGGFSALKQAIDMGDIVGVTAGAMRRTDKGELSVVAQKLEVLTKAIRPLPDKWHGLTDVEKRYRQRYVDFIVTEEARTTMRRRAAITSAIRGMLAQDDFLEIETPVLESVAGGADARPFITYHNTMKRNYTLRIATELHLKRLVVGGFERVYEMGRIFRNEGVSTRHNPEFTSIEVYQAYADYNDMMELTERMIRQAAETACGTAQVSYQGLDLDFASPFRRATMHDLVREATDVDFWALQEAGDLQGARDAAGAALEAAGASYKEKAAVASAPSIGHVVNEVFEAVVESTLQQPCFVMDHPIEISPLAKKHRSKEGLVERFELFIAGRELANSFSELTDPVDQRQRLEAQVTTHQERAAAAAEAGASKEGEEEDDELAYDVEVDEDFLVALEHGMPPTAGMGMGIDRLVMLLTDSPSIRDVIAFPLLK